MPHNERRWEREPGTGRDTLDLDGLARVRARHDSYEVVRDAPDGTVETLGGGGMPRIANITELRCFAERAAARVLAGLREIHFHESGPDLPDSLRAVHGWAEAGKAISAGNGRVDTTQMGLLGTSLFEKNYRVFVHPASGRPYEIRLGANACTLREIRRGHDLFRLWAAGEFSLD